MGCLPGQVQLRRPLHRRCTMRCRVCAFVQSSSDIAVQFPWPAQALNLLFIVGRGEDQCIHGEDNFAVWAWHIATCIAVLLVATRGHVIHDARISQHMSGIDRIPLASSFSRGVVALQHQVCFLDSSLLPTLLCLASEPDPISVWLAHAGGASAS